MEPQADGARGGGGGSKPPVVACGFSGDDEEKPRKNARARREKKKPSGRGSAGLITRSEPRPSWTRRPLLLIRGVVAESKRVAWPSGTHTIAGMIATLIFAALVAGFIAFVGGGL